MMHYCEFCKAAADAQNTPAEDTQKPSLLRSAGKSPLLRNIGKNLLWGAAAGGGLGLLSGVGQASQMPAFVPAKFKLKVAGAGAATGAVSGMAAGLLLAGMRTRND